MSSQPGLRSRASQRAFSFSSAFVTLLMACVFGLVSVPRAHAIKMQITYTDGANEGFFNPTLGETRRATFEAVLSNWGNRLSGSVPIQVSASFDPITDEKGNKRTILAQASPYSYLRDWSNFFNQLPPPKRAATYYPMALANQQAGRDMDSGHPDIVVQCNSNIDSDPATGFYYGLDADVPDGQSDFYSVLFHEVGHGLGFSSTYNEDGSYSIENGYADIYSVFLRSRINNSTQYLTKVSQTERAAAFLNGHVWFAGENAQLGGAEDSCLLFAPKPYSPGSSISHLDEETFHGIDELMTPASSEPVHAPGPRVTGVFRDMGWTISNTDLTAPSLTISTPTNGAVIGKSLTQIRGTTSDAGSGMGRVQLNLQRQSDGKYWTGSDWGDATLLKATISVTTWTLSNLPSNSDLAYGTYKLSVKAWDTANNSKFVTSTFEVADVSEPNAYIAYPVEGVGYKILTTSAGTSSNNTDYVKVALRNSDGKYWNWNTSAFGDTTFVDSDNAKRVQVPPYNWQTSVPTVPDGDYTLFAASVNTADVGSQYVARNYYIDATGPDLKLTDPSPTSSTTSLTSLSGTCIDRSGIKDNKVTFTLYQNGQYWTGSAWTDTQTSLSATVQSDGTWTYTTLPTENIRSGVYYFSANATDTLGNVSAATPGANQTSFRVDASPPTCTITSPANGSLVNGITSITGTANDDALDRVSLYILRYSDGAFWDGTAWAGGGSAILPVSIDSSTHVWTSTGSLPGNNASDAAHSWTNGSYDIIAIAYDQAGNQTRADSVVTYQYAYTWTGATMRDNDPNNDSNNWDNAANWLPYGIPGADDNALIKNGDTVKADGSHTVKGLTVTGSTLSTSGLLVKNLDLNGNIYGGAVNSNGGTWNWTGGSISGTWTLFSGATLNIDGKDIKQLSDGTIFNNSGMTTFSGSGALRGFQNSTFNNLKGATFTLNNSSDVFDNFYGGNTFNNAVGATFKKESAVNDPKSVSTINDWTFNNNGAIVSNMGILDFTAGLNLNDGSTVSGSSFTRLSGGTLASTGTPTIQSTTFDMTAGNLGGTGTLVTVGTSTFNWTGGQILRLNVGSSTTLNVIGPDIKQIADGGVINNAGKATLKDAGPLRGFQNSTFNNLKGAKFTFASDADLTNFYGGNAFNNQSGATVEKTVGLATDSSQSDWAFNNSGTTKVAQGVLALGAGGTDAGTFAAITPGITRFIGGTHTLNTATVFTGNGKTQLTAATLVLAGNVVSGSSSAGTTLEVSGGTINGPSTANLTCYGMVNWMGGQIGSVCNITSNAVLNLLGDEIKQIGDRGIINNSGTTKWTGKGPLRGFQNSTFNNVSGGIFNVVADGQVFTDFYGGNVFNNQSGATFTKTAGPNTTNLTSWTFNNNGGAVNIASGTLQSQLALNINANSSVSGAGTLQLSGPTTLKSVLTSAARITLENDLNCPQPVGAAPAHYAGKGILDWKGGTINGTLALDAGTQCNLVGEGIKQIGNGSIINNSGTAKWSGTGPLRGFQNSTWNNLSGSTFNVADDGEVLANFYGGNVFNNQEGATFTKTAGTKTTTLTNWTFNNSGSIAANAGTAPTSGAAIQFDTSLNLNGGKVSGTRFVRFNNGTLNITATPTIVGTTFELTGGTTDGTGTLATSNGVIKWVKGTINQLTTAKGAVLNITGTEQRLIGNGGVLTNNGTATWSGGNIQGYQNSVLVNGVGAIFTDVSKANFVDFYGGNLFKNAGTFKTGASVGKTTMSWGFAQLSTGTLAVDVTSNAATGFDIYSVGGAATLAGTLQIVRPSSYLPSVGSTFKFLTGGTRTGQFATVQNTTIDSARQFQVLYNTQDVTLQVKGVSLSVNDVKVTEGTGAGKGGTATFAVTLSGAQTVPVTVKYATASGTALSGTDFTASTGTLTFAPGEKSKTIKVSIVGDSLDEANETFALNLSSPTNAAIGDGSGVGTIVDDDAAPSLSVNDVSLAEGNSGTKAMVFTIRLSTASGQSVIVNYATANATATAGSDYTNLVGSLTFAPGETTKTVSIAIKGDTAREANETFTLALSRATNAMIADGVGIGTIINDDGAASPSVTNGSDFTLDGSAGSS